VLEDGYGPSMTSDDLADAQEDESSDVQEQSPQHQSTTRSSLPQTPSTEDLAAKKKASRTAGSGLRAPTAGKSESVSKELTLVDC